MNSQWLAGHTFIRPKNAFVHERSVFYLIKLMLEFLQIYENNQKQNDLDLIYHTVKFQLKPLKKTKVKNNF